MSKLIGKAKGFGNDVEVDIETKGFAVSKMTAKGPNETPAVGGKAIEKFNDEILPEFVEKNKGKSYSEIDYQSIDAVSGALLTTHAVRKSAEIASGRARNDTDNKQDLKKQIKNLNYRVQNLEDGAGISMSSLNEWLQDRQNIAAASSAGKFLEGESNKPTKENLKEILYTAGNYMWRHMLTAPHYIVISDPKEQKSLLSEMGVTGFGTVTILVLVDGVKDQAHHK